MTETSWAALRDLVAERYEELCARLTRRLGSEDLAAESLHEVWLRLDLPGHAGPVQNPSAFLLTVATNVARDHLRRDRRRARRAEIAAALQMADSAHATDHEVEASLDLKTVERAIMELPERSRAIFFASRLEGLTHRAIAQRLGVSRRTVQYELERTVRTLAALFEEK